jgi:DNA-directed RNA polymerase specialized sigma24 family protein
MQENGEIISWDEALERLLHIARGRGRATEHEAEDAVQESLKKEAQEKKKKGLNLFQQVGITPIEWRDLQRKVRNKASYHRKKNRRRGEIFSGLVTAGHFDREVPDPFEEVSKRDLIEYIRRAMGQLNYLEAKVIEEYYFNGRSEKEIASRWRRPRLLIKKLLTNARKHLRCALNQLDKSLTRG